MIWQDGFLTLDTDDFIEKFIDKMLERIEKK